MDREDAGYPDAGHIEGRYANYFEVGHNAFEFLIDFGQCYSEGEAAQVHTRIIMSPIYAKALLETLRNALERYEHTFGPAHGQEHTAGT